MLREAGARSVRTAIIFGTTVVVEGNDCQCATVQQNLTVIGALCFARHQKERIKYEDQF